MMSTHDRLHREGICSSILDTIGGTPIVNLARLVPSSKGRILLKLEYFSPGHSKKDRVAKHIVLEARRGGRLAPGQIVVEATSGNTGVGLAIVCAATGHPFVAVISTGNSPERAQMMRALGAEVILVPQAAGGLVGQVSGADLECVEKVVTEIVGERGAFRAAQFDNVDNAAAHASFTAEEILAQTNGEFDAFCDFVGTGGSLGGIARRFNADLPQIRCYAVEPRGAAVLSGRPWTPAPHRVQGGGYGRSELANLDLRDVDGSIEVSDEEAIYWARQLAAREGIFAGYSTGANVAAAMTLLQSVHPGGTVLALACDSGLKYLSTELWNSAP